MKCDTYDENKVLETIRKGPDLIGGINIFVKAGERIVLKPNVLIGTSPEKCVTTHPSVFKAVGTLIKEAGSSVYYGDSPGFGDTEAHFKRAGLKQIADEMEFGLADFGSGRSVSHKDALLIKQFVIASGVLDSDGLVSLPKFKTHGLTRLTGAVKNQFGCIPGLRKGQYHAKLPDPYDFSTMLVDLNTAIKPRLYVMDGIVAMEGNGPRSGNPKSLNVLLLSDDPIALDATACRIIDLDPEIVPTSKPGEKAELGTYHAENIEIVGESIDSFLDRKFEVIRIPVEHRTAGRFSNFIKNRITDKPVINSEICNNCGTCIEMCPVEPKAVNWNGNDQTRPPSYHYDGCIRCYCCQEICPEGAITINRSLLAKILSPN
jgi:uncharacterized protein (DUF362 family)/NAD-dependent dihydropyrimidine dehydrogenase PreA subunit